MKIILKCETTEEGPIEVPFTILSQRPSKNNSFVIEYLLKTPEEEYFIGTQPTEFQWVLVRLEKRVKNLTLWEQLT